MSDHDEEESKLGRAFDREQLRRLLQFARPHWKLFTGIIALLFVNFGLELLGPWIVRLAVDGPLRAFEDPEVRASLTLMDAQKMELLKYLGLYLLIALSSGTLDFFELVLMTRAGQSVIFDIRLKLVRHLQSLSLRFFDKNPVGTLVTRTTSDVENLAELFTSGVVIFLFDLTKIVVIVSLLFWINVKLALVTLAFSPFLILGATLFKKFARDAYRKVRYHLARLNGYLQEVISGVRVVQVFNQEKKVAEKFDGINADYRQAALRTVFFFSILYPSVDFLIYGTVGTIFWVAGQDILADALTVGVFIQFWLYLQQLFEPIRQLGEKYNLLQSAMASSERIFKILDTQAEIESPEKPVQLNGVRGEIEFENVHFGYTEKIPILKGVSFKANPGEKIALVGSTGAGKTTILSLLSRFYEPQSGRITLDGVDLRQLDPGEMRTKIGFVPQDVFLFAGNVGDNISLNRPGIGEREVQEAVGYAQAGPFIARLEDGLASEVKERGVTFSMGERQLLAYARALAGNPPIVVLDEATANIDTETEAKIQEATHKLLEGRTAIIVAHRLSTVREADRILVLHKGELVEEGNHKELLAKGGIYSRLHRLQFA